MSNRAEDIEPLLKKYGKQKHPLDYNNRYQLIVMVVLAAQASDNQINKVAIDFFKECPSIASLRQSTPEDLYPLLSSVRGFRKKAAWLVKMANAIGDDKNIPHTMQELTKLPGIGRKSANVIIRESGDNAEGIVVDLHVVRVAPRIGLVSSENPDKIEKELMQLMPQDRWNETGMALSFHGREICRPKPMCEVCIVKEVCNYYQTKIKTDNPA